MGLTYSELQNEVKERSLRAQSGTEFDTTIKRIINTSIRTVSREALWKILRRDDTIQTETSYTTGSGAAAVTNGSASFTVTGATFLTDNVKPGRRIKFSTDQRYYIIQTITGETTGTLDRDFDGTTSTSATYEVLPTEIYKSQSVSSSGTMTTNIHSKCLM